MKQSVIFKSVLFAMVTLPLLTACTDDSNSSVGNVSNELKINVGIATPQKPDFVPAISRVNNPAGAIIYTWGTQAPETTNPTSFNTNESIGIFVRSTDPSSTYESPYGFITWDLSAGPGLEVPQITGAYDNLKYTSLGSREIGTGTQLWNLVPSTPIPTVFLSSQYARICAYYPYDASLYYDGNEYTYTCNPYGAGTGPYYLVPTPTGNTGGSVSDYSVSGSGWYIDCSAGVDYMYAPNTGAKSGGDVCSTSPLVDLTMHHAQTCLKFKVSVPNTFLGTAKITKFKVYGGFAMKAYTDIWDGTYTVSMPTDLSTGLPATADTINVETSASSGLHTLSATSAYERAYFCVPYNESVPTTLHIECEIEGHTYHATISSLLLLREWIYEIPLMLTQGQLVVSSVDIIPWTINSSIPITPLL